MSFLSEAFAQASQTTTTTENPIMSLLPLVLIFAVFYVFLIRPQQKKLKEHAALVNSVKRGDEVVTGGGIIGKVSKVEEGTSITHVEIADGVVVRINKSTIIEVLSGKGNANANANSEKLQTEKTSKKSKAKK